MNINDFLDEIINKTAVERNNRITEFYNQNPFASLADLTGDKELNEWNGLLTLLADYKNNKSVSRQSINAAPITDKTDTPSNSEIFSNTNSKEDSAQAPIIEMSLKEDILREVLSKSNENNDSMILDDETSENFEEQINAEDLDSNPSFTMENTESHEAVSEDSTFVEDTPKDIESNINPNSIKLYKGNGECNYSKFKASAGEICIWTFPLTPPEEGANPLLFVNIYYKNKWWGYSSIVDHSVSMLQTRIGQVCFMVSAFYDNKNKLVVNIVSKGEEQVIPIVSENYSVENYLNAPYNSIYGEGQVIAIPMPDNNDEYSVLSVNNQFCDFYHLGANKPFALIHDMSEEEDRRFKVFIEGNEIIVEEE